jgi:Flp pilus assembly protein TadG
MKRSSLGEVGSALVETALVLPVVLASIGGAIQLFLIMMAVHLTDYAAFYATRTAIVHGASEKMAKRAAVTALMSLEGAVDLADPATAIAWAKTSAATKVEIVGLDDLDEPLIPESADRFEDNLLRVRLVYGAPVVVPVIGKLMLRILRPHLLRDADGGIDPFRVALVAAGRYPLEAECVLRNQSVISAGTGD